MKKSWEIFEIFEKVRKQIPNKKKIVFIEVEKNFEYSFDAENAHLSIAGIFRAIRALQRERPGKHCQTYGFHGTSLRLHIMFL